MTAPVGAVVRIYVDLRDQVDVGDIIETTSGRRYHVLAVRVQQRGKHVGRQHLSVLVVPKNWAPDIDTGRLHLIRWYRRRARRRR